MSTDDFDAGIRAPIDKLYAWVSDEGGGAEGVIAWRFGDTMMPLVGADRDRIESFRGHAQKTAQLTGRKVRLVSFGTRVDLETLEP